MTTRRTFLRSLVLTLAAATLPVAARAADPVGLVVIREHGVGSAAQAQTYLDRLAQAAARVNGWPGVTSRYFTSRKLAKPWIDSHRPAFGILTLPALLALRGPYDLEILGTADVATAGGRRYFIVAKGGGTLDDCRGKRLASNHVDDARFIERVVAAGAFRLSDFQLVPTRRPVQTIKAVVRGEADCGLIDDAQQADLAHIEGGRELAAVWRSRELPPMAVVAFGNADPAQKAAFKKNLPKVCRGEGKKACEEVGIRRLTPTGPGPYRKVLSAYGK